MKVDWEAERRIISELDELAIEELKRKTEMKVDDLLPIYRFNKSLLESRLKVMSAFGVVQVEGEKVRLLSLPEFELPLEFEYYINKDTERVAYLLLKELGGEGERHLMLSLMEFKGYTTYPDFVTDGLSSLKRKGIVEMERMGKLRVLWRIVVDLFCLKDLDSLLEEVSKRRKVYRKV